MAEYHNAHNAVKRRYGAASLYVCVWCGREAAHWAYAHSAADERREPGRGPYSMDPRDYQPMCVRDHKHMDGLLRRNASPQQFVNAAVAAYKRRPFVLKILAQITAAENRRRYVALSGHQIETWERPESAPRPAEETD